MRVRTADVVLSSTDEEKQFPDDLARLFDFFRERRYAWVTGTGLSTLDDELHLGDSFRNYRLWIPEQSRSGNFIAVREDLVDSRWKTGHENGLTNVQFTSDRLGPVAVATVGSDSASDTWMKRRMPAKGLLFLGTERGRGSRVLGARTRTVADTELFLKVDFQVKEAVYEVEELATPTR